jgi:hypothetical protein
MREKLREHIKRSRLSDHAEEITTALDALVQSADDFLWAYPGGVPWTESFEREYRGTLEAKHPWIDSDSFQQILAYSRWLCWHEGLNASG